MNCKSILFINRVAPPANGATGRVMQDVITALQADGWDASFLSSKSTETNIKGYLHAWWFLFVQMTRMPQTNIVVFMTDPPFLVWQLLFWPFRRTTKLVHWCHDVYPDLLPKMGYKFPEFFISFARRLSVMAMNRCNAVIAIGRCMKDHLVKCGVQESRIVVIPNWAPLQLHLLPYKPREIMRVLYAGNFGLNHSLDALLDAADHFKNDARIHFIFSGQGKKRAELQNIIVAKNLNNCEVTDFVPDDQLNNLLSEADLHITVMNDDALGLLVPCKIYSAPAAGRYSLFLGPQKSEAALFLQDHQLGTTLPNNPASLIQKLEAILVDRTAFDLDIKNLRPPPSSLPLFVAFMEKLHNI